MDFFGKLTHYFTPHHRNNFRAKLLQNATILALLLVVLFSNLFIKLLEATPLHILGFASSITISDVVSATNAERAKSGLAPLNYSEKLADAARRKAANMLEENYWSHNSPSGKSPWTWFKAAGYGYLFAGENLAKDFGSTDRMISAWMASPTHRDNILNNKYQEIGIAVVPGTLQGKETMLVVQLFGTPSTSGSVVGTNTSSLPKQPAPTPVPTPSAVEVVSVQEEVAPTPAESLAPQAPVVAEISQTPVLIDEFSLKKVLSIAVIVLFILALVLDLLIAESQALSRRVGKNWAHIIFVNLVLFAATIISAGSIL